MSFRFIMKISKFLVEIILFMILGALLGYAFGMMASDAKCEWCPDMKCFSSSDCGPDCSCLWEANAMSGRCVSIQ